MKATKNHPMDAECRDVQKRLAGMRPSDPLAPAVEAHLAQCEICREAQRTDARVWAVLDDYRAPPAPDSLLERLQERIAEPVDELARKRASSPTRARRTPIGFAAAAAAVILLGAGLGSWIGSRSADRSAASAARATEAVAEDAELFSVDPPGSLSRAYASLESSGGRR